MDIHDAIQHLQEMLKDNRIGMLTTLAEDGTLHARPMVVQDLEFKGDLWFFTNEESDIAAQVSHNTQVNVSFVGTKGNRFLSASGTAGLVRDPIKLRELWSSAAGIYFPKGLDDPSLVLVRVTVNTIAWWEGAASPIGRITNLFKAWADRDPSALGQSGKATI